MKRLFHLPLILIFLIQCSDERKDVARQIANQGRHHVYHEFMKEVDEISKKKGSQAAIEFYRENLNSKTGSASQQLLDKYRKNYNIYEFNHKRVSIRYRNPINQANGWYGEILQIWGQNLRKQQPLQISVRKIKRGYEAMAPIVANESCLKCHGTVQKTGVPVRDYLKKQYVGDRARDFHPGDLMGAFVAEIKFRD